MPKHLKKHCFFGCTNIHTSELRLGSQRLFTENISIEWALRRFALYEWHSLLFRHPQIVSRMPFNSTTADLVRCFDSMEFLHTLLFQAIFYLFHSFHAIFPCVFGFFFAPPFAMPFHHDNAHTACESFLSAALQMWWIDACIHTHKCTDFRMRASK